MSLIEQAAKRLEELRRAGADLQEKPSSSEETENATGELPTPEAVVRALEARSQPVMPSQAQRQGHGSAPRRPIDKITEALRPALRRAEIDLEQLAARGFVTPNAPKSQLA